MSFFTSFSNRFQEISTNALSAGKYQNQSLTTMQEKRIPHQIVARLTGVIWRWQDKSAKREARGHGFSGNLALKPTRCLRAACQLWSQVCRVRTSHCARSLRAWSISVWLHLVGRPLSVVLLSSGPISGPHAGSEKVKLLWFKRKIRDCSQSTW